jgi:hypothetical protein
MSGASACCTQPGNSAMRAPPDGAVVPLVFCGDAFAAVRASVPNAPGNRVAIGANVRARPTANFVTAGRVNRFAIRKRSTRSRNGLR